MTDDRTEDALRRALDDAARQVNVPAGRLPEPTATPEPVRRRGVPVPAVVALVLLVVGGSVAFVAARDGDGPTNIASSGAGAEPITSDNADIILSVDLDATDEQIAAVRAFAEASPAIVGYTFVSAEDAILEIRAAPCSAPDREISSAPAPLFRFRAASADDVQPVVRELAVLPGVLQVIWRSGDPTTYSGSGTAVSNAAPSALAPPVPTVSRDGNTGDVAVVGQPVAPTTTHGTTATGGTPTTVPGEPATTAPETTTTTAPESSTTTVPDVPTTTVAASKEVPFVGPARAGCAPVPSLTPSPVPPSTGPPATLPPAGAPPADPASAEQQVRDMWVYTHDGSTTGDKFVGRLEDYDELHPLVVRAASGRESTLTTMTVKILGVQFVSPTRAAVLYQQVFGSSPDMVQLQYAVLVDGHWMIARESMCEALPRAGVHCPEGP